MLQYKYTLAKEVLKMKYFSYQYSESMGRVWSLFSDLSSLSRIDSKDTNRRWDYSHTSEIINSAMNGNLYHEDFDLKAYEIACAKTDEIELSNMRKKYLTIVDNVNSEDVTVGYGEISSNDKRLRTVEDAFAMLDDNDEFEKCLCELYNIRKDYIVEKGVDPVEMLSNSLKGIPEAVSSMSELFLEDMKLRRIVEVLCENGANTLQIRLEGAF